MGTKIGNGKFTYEVLVDWASATLKDGLLSKRPMWQWTQKTLVYLLTNRRTPCDRFRSRRKCSIVMG